MANQDSNRGIGGRDKEKQEDGARKGGKEARRQGKPHEFDSEEARTAGHKGGEKAPAQGAAREEARKAGREGEQRS